MKLKIILKPGGPKLFFTSDTHYAHKNICRGVTEWKDAEDITRDFKTLEEMNQTIVDNINNIVKEDDILIHCGDWSFGGIDKIWEFRKQIKCKNIHLILGNHDEHILKNKLNTQSLFSSVQHYLDLKVDVQTSLVEKWNIPEKYNFICMHYPIISWENMNKGVYHLFGHVHLPSNKRIMEGKAMDIGMDGNNLKPLEYIEIVNLLKNNPIKKSYLPSDHHERDIR